ncbi:MAG: acetyltransferase, partial [Bacteroides sp.]|nr:acetyltransferase [Bacteroides sp.]
RAMNLHRKDVCERMLSFGYSLASFISPLAITHDNVSIGRNVFIFELNNIQPFSTIEDGVVLWSGNHIGHHSVVKLYCFISSHVVVSGHCKIGQRSFLGVNSTIIDGIELGARNLVGAGATIASNTDNDAVWTAKHTKKAAGKSMRYL